MSPYKSFIASAKNYFASNVFLKFLLSASIFIFAAGGLLYLLGLFIGSVYEAFVCIGSILIWAGLLLSIVKEDVMTILITSGTIALGSLVAWIVKLAGAGGYYGIGGGYFAFTPFFFFLIFGAIAIVVPIKAEKFKQMRAAAAAAAAARPQGIPCPRCGNIVPFGSAFCPACGAPAPQYAPPQPPPYAAPQYAPPQPPPYAPPAEPAAAPAAKKCVNCGADLPLDAVYCGKCGTKQP